MGLCAGGKPAPRGGSRGWLLGNKVITPPPLPQGTGAPLIWTFELIRTFAQTWLSFTSSVIFIHSWKGHIEQNFGNQARLRLLMPVVVRTLGVRATFTCTVLFWYLLRTLQVVPVLDHFIETFIILQASCRRCEEKKDLYDFWSLVIFVLPTWMIEPFSNIYFYWYIM